MLIKVLKLKQIKLRSRSTKMMNLKIMERLLKKRTWKIGLENINTKLLQSCTFSKFVSFYILHCFLPCVKNQFSIFNNFCDSKLSKHLFSTGSQKQYRENKKSSTFNKH